MTDTPIRDRHVLVWTSYFEPGFRGGGPIRSLARILDSAPADTRATVVTRDRDLGDTEPYPGLSGRWTTRGPHRVFYVDVRSCQHWWRLITELRRTPFELLYVNSLWSPLFTVLPVVATRLRLIEAAGILLAPRGELAPGALALKSRKKRWALRAWSPVLQRAGVRWHASADEEATAIQAALPWADLLVVGNETGHEPTVPPSEPHAGPLRLVFISRISPMKNLLGLLEALTRVSGEVSLDIYGPLEDQRYWANCAAVIERLPAHVSVQYGGVLRHEQVIQTFSRYDAFSLPTRGENFGHVIAESLRASCPVICSDLTPWSAVLREGGGEVLVDLSVDTIATTLDAWIALTPEERHHRRLAAGNVYRRWAAAQDGANVLDVARSSPADTPRSPRRRRVALVTQGFAAGGGVPQVARWLRSGLEATGRYEVDMHDVATSRRDPYSRRLTDPRTWLRTNLRGPVRDGVQSWGANGVEIEPFRYRPRRELTRTLNQYDLVQVVSGGPALAAVTRKVRRPVVLHFATRVEWERASQQVAMRLPVRTWRKAMTALVDRAERRALRSVDAVLAQNQHLRDVAAPLAGGPTMFAAPGVDIERFRPHPGGLQRDGHLLSVCRLGDPRKGLLRLVEAYGIAVAGNDAVPSLVLAGKGELSASVTELIARLKLGDRVHILRDVPQEELPELYQGASVYVQASYEEGFGLSVAEAMASGLPVICTDTAGTRETVVDGVTGWVVDQEDSESVPARIAEAIREALTFEGAERGEAGRTRCVELMADELTLGKVTSLYDSLTADTFRRTTSA
ncbi:glycosyltransferase [Geodermatophilus sp. SYSU D01176]